MINLWSVTPKIVCLINPDHGSLSFRTTDHAISQTHVCANEVAGFFGGGGHPQAAGAQMPEDMKPLDTIGFAERVKKLIEDEYA